MKVGTQYAAKRLGVSKMTVRNMIARGELTDISGRHGRHEARLDRTEVVNFAKTHQRVGRRWVANTDKRNEFVDMHTGKSVRLADFVAAEKPKTGLMFERLDQIEAKLDRIIKVWG